jgi:AcrR family transcriptional regulator
MARPRKNSVPPPQNGRLSREAWISAALDALIRHGVERVKVLPLARALGVTRGSFYWHFADRAELLEALLDLWTGKNTRGIVAAADRGDRSIIDSVLNVFELWVDSSRFDPKLDFAVREWARRSSRVHAIVAAADAERVAALARMFKRAGFARKEAFVRARILYYMQIGYFALDVRETMKQRLGFIHEYLVGFTGTTPSRRTVAAFARKALADLPG